ncbi:hypothetical protein [Sporosalibacterium faouarense]|uniref:hypothetical protein n=1 Tax=Sporosalibacterium faouarense TaxID=516123 RepID=UPI00141CB66E|nr:hypothetical protein [Sporosalibacterium faouarense]MTI46346.1 hypothetical protein [Bacillota bacterium]
MFILVILAYLIVGFIEVVPLVNNGEKSEVMVFSVLFLTAFILSLLLSLGVKVPSPIIPIEKIVDSFIY